MSVKHSIDPKVWIKKRQHVAKNSPRVAAVVAREFALKNFQDESFKDIPTKAWKARKANESGARRALLVKTGFLKRGFRTVVRGTNSALVNHAPYANIHNQGGTIHSTHRVREHRRKKSTVKEHNRTVNITIPQRQFIGNSQVLHQLIRNKINQLLYQ